MIIKINIHFKKETFFSDKYCLQSLGEKEECLFYAYKMVNLNCKYGAFKPKELANFCK